MILFAKGTIEHPALLDQFSEALTKIGDVLPDVESGFRLFRNFEMKETISEVYGHIILFLLKAAQWYTRGPASHRMPVIPGCVELDYKETVQQIALCQPSAEDLANTAPRSEIREIREELRLQRPQILDMRAELKVQNENLNTELRRQEPNIRKLQMHMQIQRTEQERRDQRQEYKDREKEERDRKMFDKMEELSKSQSNIQGTLMTIAKNSTSKQSLNSSQTKQHAYCPRPTNHYQESRFQHPRD